MSTNKIQNVLNNCQKIHTITLPPVDSLCGLKCEFSSLLESDSEIRQLWESFYDTNDMMELTNKNGKILKRFQKFVKVNYDKKLDTKIMGWMGDKLQALVQSTESKLYFDITSTFDWNDGHFGKSGSCWWGEYGDSLTTFESGGGYCLRFYSSESDKRGIGRTWLYFRDSLLIGFNSYGVDKNVVCKILKIFFAENGLELYGPARLGIENSKASCNIPYVNGGTGFQFSLNNIFCEDDFDLLMPQVENEACQNRYTCDSCGDRISEDEVRNDGYGNTYCESCFADKFTYCDRCGSTVENDDIIIIEDHSRYNAVCSRCNERKINAVECSDCGRFYCDYVITDDSGKAFCESCADGNTHYCEKCEQTLEYTCSCEDDESEESTDEESSELESEESSDGFLTSELELKFSNETKNVKVTYLPNTGIGIMKARDIPDNLKENGYRIIHTESNKWIIKNLNESTLEYAKTVYRQMLNVQDKTTGQNVNWNLNPNELYRIIPFDSIMAIRNQYTGSGK